MLGRATPITRHRTIIPRANVASAAAPAVLQCEPNSWLTVSNKASAAQALAFFLVNTSMADPSFLMAHASAMPRNPFYLPQLSFNPVPRLNPGLPAAWSWRSATK